MPHLRPFALLAALALLGAPTGCVGSTPAPSVTVTRTAEAPSTRMPAPTKDPLRSDVVGRRFDFGAVVKVVQVQGTDIAVLDRWTDNRVPDAKLATSGVPMAPWSSAQSPFRNQNSRTTFRIPVRPNATVLWRHCVAPDQPLQVKSVAVGDFVKAAATDKLVLVRLDTQGWAVAVDGIPGC